MAFKQSVQSDAKIENRAAKHYRIDQWSAGNVLNHKWDSRGAQSRASLVEQQRVVGFMKGRRYAVALAWRRCVNKVIEWRAALVAVSFKITEVRERVSLDEGERIPRLRLGVGGGDLALNSGGLAGEPETQR